jgi:spoIIIJ-associated protein
MSTRLHQRISDLVTTIVSSMGLSLQASVEETGDTIRVNLTGEDAEWLVRRRGDGLEALQHIVSTVFRRELKDGRGIVVDALGFRRAKDAELREMARLLIERAKSTGETQEIGPLNPYGRRLVHLTVAEDAAVASESIGDAFLKKVLISPRQR